MESCAKKLAVVFMMLVSSIKILERIFTRKKSRNLGIYASDLETGAKKCISNGF